MSDAFDAPTMPVPRDGWKRPLIVPPEGGKPRAYTRCTTFVRCLEDTHALELWKQRMVALGLADRPDLLLSVSAHRDDKQVLNEVCKRAAEAAQASAGATKGTALHSLTEQLDRGRTLGVVPEGTLADLNAYRQATASLRHVAIEQFCINDEFQVGGTPDRASYVPSVAEYVIADLKSGASEIEYGGLVIAMQLAMYAHSLIYDAATGARLPWRDPLTDTRFDIDLDRALVIHLPAGSGRCELHWIDINAGWEAVRTAAKVRQWRAYKNWWEPFVPPTPPIVGMSTADEVEQKIRQSSTVEELRGVWSHAIAAGTWTDQHLSIALQRKDELDKVAS